MTNLEEQIYKICKDRHKSKTKHIGCTGAIYYRYSPQKLSRAISKLLEKKYIEEIL
jgi:hypothetical protein